MLRYWKIWKQTNENEILSIHRQKSTRSRTCSTSSTSESSTFFERGVFVCTCRHSSFCRWLSESIDENLQCEPSINIVVLIINFIAKLRFPKSKFIFIHYLAIAYNINLPFLLHSQQMFESSRANTIRCLRQITLLCSLKGPAFENSVEWRRSIDLMWSESFCLDPGNLSLEFSWFCFVLSSTRCLSLSINFYNKKDIISVIFNRRFPEP